MRLSVGVSLSKESIRKLSGYHYSNISNMYQPLFIIICERIFGTTPFNLKESSVILLGVAILVVQAYFAKKWIMVELHDLSTLRNKDLFFVRFFFFLLPPIFLTVQLYSIVSYTKMAKHRIGTGSAGPILCFQDALCCL